MAHPQAQCPLSTRRMQMSRLGRLESLRRVDCRHRFPDHLLHCVSSSSLVTSTSYHSPSRANGPLTTSPHFTSFPHLIPSPHHLTSSPHLITSPYPLTPSPHLTSPHPLTSSPPHLLTLLQAFTGLIDEFRVWGAVRSDEQLRDSVFQGARSADPDLHLYWQFDVPGLTQNML